MTRILGISAYYHDSAAALVVDGQILAAAQQERFSRKKHDARFPVDAINFCLREGRIELTDVDHVVFYDKPLIKFERLLETYLAFAPRGFSSFVSAMPVWLKEKLYLKSVLKTELAKLSGVKVKQLPPLWFTEHHQAHAGAAFFPSPFREAAVLCLDGVGEWATGSVWHGQDKSLTSLWEIDFPHSLGLLYSAFTYYCGFKVNSGEYKLMGLAPYGEPRYVDTIMHNLLDIKADGTFRLNMDYFEYATGLRMTSAKFNALFDGEPRQPEMALTQREMDLACSIQRVTEEIVLRLAKTARKETGSSNLCMAGGVALNCVANGQLDKQKVFDELWIQPAAGDAGSAIGAALCVWHEFLGNERELTNGSDAMQGSYLGPEYTDDEIKTCLDKYGAVYTALNESQLIPRVAQLISESRVVGWFQGRMEFGPRALGSRSILGDPRDPNMQSVMNLKIKYRESFRPFAPSVLAERAHDIFDLSCASPYMLLVAKVNDDYYLPVEELAVEKATGLEKLKILRSTLPAITHVDYSARIQTVHQETNPRYYRLIDEFERITGCPVLINTSFNVRGEPIVCLPDDAYRCFMRTEMDYLALGNYLLAKKDQPELQEDKDWRNDFELD